MSTNGDEDQKTRECPECEGLTGADFLYCSQCGTSLSLQKEEGMSEEKNEEMEEFESEEAEDPKTEVKESKTESEEAAEAEESEEEVPPEPSTYSKLKGLEYRELQLLAMDAGIRGDLGTEDLIEKLSEKFELEKPESEQVESGETEVEPEESDAESESEKWKPNGDQSAEPSKDGEDTNDSSDGSEDNSSHPKKPESGSGGLNGDGGSGSGNEGHTDGGSEAGDGFNLPFVGMIFCLIALALLLLFAFWDYQNSEVKQKDETKVVHSPKKSEKSKDEQSQEESDKPEKQTGLEYQSQRKLAEKVWKRIPNDLEPKLRKFEGLIGLRPRLAYEKCESFEELGDCGDFVDIYSRIDSRAVVEDRINDIRDRHQDTDS